VADNHYVMALPLSAQTLTARGLEELFSLVVSVIGSGGKLVLVLHTYVLELQYSCGVVLVF
jgi:hypothetical protein